MIHTLKFLVEELKYPFKDPRIEKELKDEELFY